MHYVMRSTDEHKYVHMPTFFNTTCEKKTLCAGAMFRGIQMNSDCLLFKTITESVKRKTAQEINPGPPGENSKD